MHILFDAFKYKIYIRQLFVLEQAEKLKSREMKYEGWKMNDESWNMKDES